MKSRSPMKRSARWLLAAVAVLAWSLQPDPAHELRAQGRVAQAVEVERLRLDLHLPLHHGARLPGSHASWESLFAAGHW